MINIIKVIIIDDHQIVRDGIKAILSSAENIFIVGEGGSADDCFEILNNEKVDVALVDISLPQKSGIELTKELSARYPDIKVLVLSMYTSEDFIISAINAGAKGYLPKNTTKKELVNAIVKINKGEEFFSPNISDILLKSYINKAKVNCNEKKKISLSEREMEILQLYAEGLTNQQISERLFISVHTVATHKSHIMQKLNIKTTLQLLKYAIEMRNKKL